MLQIVLLVLKIIGIILASVLGILIALVLIVLFVPIRYKLKAEYEEDFKAAARITWLLRIVSFTADFGREDLEVPDIQGEEIDKDMNFRMRLRIFGRIIFDSSKKEEEEIKAAEKKRRFFSLRGKKSGKAKEKAVKGELSLAKRNKEQVKPKINSEEKQLPGHGTAMKADRDTGLIPADEKAETVTRAEIVRITKAASEAVPGMETNEKAKVTEQKLLIEKIPAETENSGKSSGGAFHFIKKIGARIKNLWNKGKAFFNSLKEKVKNIGFNLSKLNDKYQLIKLFFQDEKNKLGFKYGFDNIKGLLRHIRPRKVKAYIEFGTGDPCSTGQILGVAAVFMGIYKDSVQIIPDFEDEVFKGNFYCRGRIQGIILLIIGIKVIRNRDIRTLMNNFQTLKEEF